MAAINSAQSASRTPDFFDPFTALTIGVVGGVIDAVSGHSANQAAIEQANANREFSANAHQIEVKDLLAAGLSPMLSYRGPGASISGGAMPNIQPVTRNTGERIMTALQAAAQIKALESGATKNDAEANLADANSAKARAETTAIERGMAKIQPEVGLIGATTAEKQQAIAESKQRVLHLAQQIKEIGATISLKNAQTALAQAQETGEKIDSQIKDANWNSILSMARSHALIAEYEATERALGAQAAQAAWRIKLAEWGITTTQMAELGRLVPGMSFLINPSFNKTIVK